MTAQIKVLDSLEVARTGGLDVRRKGSRYWACCPLHREMTASLCFFPDGRWHCFGCQAHGDAADLYVALHHVSLGEALRIVKGADYGQQRYEPTANDLRRAVDQWKSKQWINACKRKHAARALTMILEQTNPQSDAFWDTVATAALAEDELNLLEAGTPRQLVFWAGGQT